MKNTIIFDLDGTLLNTLEDLQISTNYALDKFSYPSLSIENVRNFVGNGVAKLIERAIPHGIDDPNFDKCLEIFKQHYSQNMLNHTSPYPGIVDMLQQLQNEGYKIGVVSNKFDTAVKELCRLYFKNLIPSAIGESETIRKKPNSDGVLKAIKELNSTIDTSIYTGDSDVDILTAHNAGLKCIGVTWGFRDLNLLQKTGADYIANKPEDILEILQKINR